MDLPPAWINMPAYRRRRNELALVATLVSQTALDRADHLAEELEDLRASHDYLEACFLEEERLRIEAEQALDHAEVMFAFERQSLSDELIITRERARFRRALLAEILRDFPEVRARYRQDVEDGVEVRRRLIFD